MTWRSLRRWMGSTVLTVTGVIACGSSDGGSGGSMTAMQACHSSCDQIGALRCPGALDASLVADCESGCADAESDESFAQCETQLQGYYGCVAAPGNIVCDGSDSYATIDGCDDEYTVANECLGGGCPDTHPINCGTGCCPTDAPICGPGTCLAPGTGGSGGSGGAVVGGAGGVGGSGGSLGGSGGSSGSCTDCIQTYCSQVIDACLSDSACSAIFQCAAACGDQTCIEQCVAQYSAGATQFQELVSCTEANCTGCG